MTETSFADQILTQFKYTPTESQVKLIHMLSNFLTKPNDNALFVLRGYAGTDDAFLVEQIGKHVKIIKGSKNNIKITTREDLRIAEGMLQAGLG